MWLLRRHQSFDEVFSVVSIHEVDEQMPAAAQANACIQIYFQKAPAQLIYYTLVPRHSILLYLVLIQKGILEELKIDGHCYSLHICSLVMHFKINILKRLITHRIPFSLFDIYESWYEFLTVIYQKSSLTRLSDAKWVLCMIIKG